MIDWQTPALSAISAGMVALVGYALHLNSKFAVLTSQVDDLRVKEDDMEEQGNRITALEATLSEIRLLVSSLQTVPALLSRMEALLQNDSRRLSVIESYVFNLPQKLDS